MGSMLDLRVRDWNTSALIHQVSQQWKAHQRLLLLAEASTNNTPLIALENVSSLIMHCAKAAHTLIRQQLSHTLQLTSGSMELLCSPSGVITFDHTYILSYIIVLFTIMHPTVGSVCAAMYCRAPTLTTELLRKHNPACLGRMQSHPCYRTCTHFKGNVGTVAK